MITVAGTVIADFFARTLADEPPRGFLTVIDEIGFHLGGAAPNTGAVLARLNVPVSLVGRIGNDPLGILVRQQIEKWADKVSLACDPDCQTTAVIGHIFSDGNRSFIYAPGASARFDTRDLNLEEEKAHGSKALHLGYAYLLPKLDGPPMLEVLRRARKLGFLTSLDVSYHSGPDWKKLRELLPFGRLYRRRVSGMASRSRLVRSCSNRQCSRRVGRHKARGGRRIRKLGTSDGSTQTANREPHLNTEVKRSSLVVVLGSRESRCLRFKRTTQNKLDFAHPVAENFAYAADECWAFDVPEV